MKKDVQKRPMQQDLGWFWCYD